VTSGNTLARQKVFVNRRGGRRDDIPTIEIRDARLLEDIDSHSRQRGTAQPWAVAPWAPVRVRRGDLRHNRRPRGSSCSGRRRSWPA